MMDAFCDGLLQAAIAKGTILRVAEALEVEPQQIYRWIGGLQPSERERSQVVARLKQLRAFEDYFDRRGKKARSSLAAAWQQ
jgi:hypothetical protein